MSPNVESNGDFPASHQQGGFRIMAHEVLQVLQNRAKVQVSLDKLLVHCSLAQPGWAWRLSR